MRRHRLIDSPERLRSKRLCHEQPRNETQRRIADHDNPLQTEDLAFVTAELDEITIPALYCDVAGVPDNYLTILENGLIRGNYRVTHVLLAWIWIQENDYELTLPDGFIEDVYRACAKLIDNNPMIADIELEAAAFLSLAGQEGRISVTFIEQVLAAQQADGSWGTTIDKWHTTVLGLLFLLHIGYPADSYPPTLSPPSS